MPMIRETIITTVNAAGRVHIAPFGIIAEGDEFIIAPFRPSTTLENLACVPFAVASHIDDVRVFAGCLTERRDWQTTPVSECPVPRLAAALSHLSLAVRAMEEHAQRPRFRCSVIAEVAHAPCRGFNRAQAAVIEATILASRLSMLPRDKVEREMAYLAIAVGKTAGEVEAEAWGWIQAKVAAYYGGEGAARPDETSGNPDHQEWL